MMDGIIFYSLSALILIFAGLTIKFKNIFYSLLSAMAVFLLVGAIFYLLGSEYNAIIQVAIYGLAIPIILGIAVMFTNLKNNNVSEVSGRLKAVMFISCGLLILAMVYLKAFFLIPSSYSFNGLSCNDFAFGKPSGLQCCGRKYTKFT